MGKKDQALELLEARRQETGFVIYGERKPITQSEFNTAGQNGYMPSIGFKVWAGDYHGEQYIRHNGKLLTVYRSYEDELDIELYCEERAGNA